VSESPGEDEEPQASGRGNIVALIAVVVLIAVGYLAFNYIDHQRKLQNCLDSGRHNCEQWLNQR
jgi:predicted negative regulator of RcsB-dependent stress response